jgi:hypothetical protein
VPRREIGKVLPMETMWDYLMEHCSASWNASAKWSVPWWDLPWETLLDLSWETTWDFELGWQLAEQTMKAIARESVTEPPMGYRMFSR